jgi:hypothetical protein
MARGQLAAIIILAFTSHPAAWADEAVPKPSMDYVYHHAESESDVRYGYIWRVLHAALERTRARFGDYELRPSTIAETNETRRLSDLMHDRTDILNVDAFAARRDMDVNLVPVRIPIDMGLLGYRLMLIRAEDQPRFDKIQTLEDLRSVRFGLSAAWIDVSIMRNSGLPVVLGRDYEGLFHMLAAGRFEAFSRGANEVTEEFNARRKSVLNLAIEKHLLLHYPMPIYFWFPNTPDGRRRAERVNAGMTAMLADGTLKTMFQAEFGEKIRALDLAHRHVIEIPNPELGAHEPLDKTELWFDPAKPD